jgi:AcrR family transcriptional regulator
MDTKEKSEPGERQRGRPADMESGEMQSRLLDSAEELFAEYGYAATSIRRLADAAGVNPALVHYYFGTKRELLGAVMDRTLEPMARAIAAMQESGSANIEKVAGLMFTMAGRHPAMPRLITREVMLSGGETQALFVKRYAPRLGGALPALFRGEQEQGRIRPDLDPGAAALMLLSLCMFPFIARSIAEPVLGIKYTDKGLQDYMTQLKLLINGGLTA